MNRNYADTKYYSEERRQYYQRVNNSEEKRRGDRGEEIARRYLLSHGYEVKGSNAAQDSFYHSDLYIRKIGEEQWHSLDVKYKRNFILELTNHWGSKGWLFTGAEYIFNIIQGRGVGYLYKRKDMVDYFNRNKGLFQDKFCKIFDGAKLWIVYSNRLNEMSFLKTFNDIKE